MSLFSCYRSITAGALRSHVLSVQASVTFRALLATACTGLPLDTSGALELLWAPLDAECEVDLYEIWCKVHCDIAECISIRLRSIFEASYFSCGRESTTLGN